MESKPDPIAIPRVVLVTGSARGLGLATAQAFRARGEHVHVVWRSSQAAVGALKGEFGARVHRANLERPEEADRLVRDVQALDGRLDCALHAVGEFVAGPLDQASAVDLERMLASNVSSAFHLMNAARAALRESRGSALFFGCAGLDALRGRREAAAYAAAKSALLVLVRSWALEEAPHGVRVNLLSPGLVPHAHAASDTHDAERRARVPMGRAGTLAEVADAALWLCSDAARYTTGADLPVSGGWQL